MYVNTFDGSGNGIYVDSESIYVDTGCWPELMHGAGLEFRNAGQDPISTAVCAGLSKRVALKIIKTYVTNQLSKTEKLMQKILLLKQIFKENWHYGLAQSQKFSKVSNILLIPDNFILRYT
ncbi:hypothetical protein RhiirA5_381094 [Rhizophagus irregularis]|uniref:Uncharacterized protein n=1 Tax=Rhizophagus irregularis TaxID=588596 RepID=A0A2N0P5Y8_9GLOM|nr:hypothetical protein RhiirA5_381094 [Rhizophagus irregularis]